MLRRLKIVTASTDPAREGRLKVAFASDDMGHVNQHFGSAAAFVIHAVAAGGCHLLEVVQFSGTAVRDGGEGKLAARLAAIEGCDAVYAEAIGPSALAQVGNRGVRGLCVPAGTPVDDILRMLADALRKGNAAAIPGFGKHRDPERFAAMAAEGWTE